MAPSSADSLVNAVNPYQQVACFCTKSVPYLTQTSAGLGSAGTIGSIPFKGGMVSVPVHRETDGTVEDRSPPQIGMGHRCNVQVRRAPRATPRPLSDKPWSAGRNCADSADFVSLNPAF